MRLLPGTLFGHSAGGLQGVCIRKAHTMHEFQDGEEARVIKHGVEVKVMVFRQTGDLVYVFDKENRAYQFPASDVLPARGLNTDTYEQGRPAARA